MTVKNNTAPSRRRGAATQVVSEALATHKVLQKCA